ncbi:MAG: hypothetical protein HY062_13675 [Bacteroidetes bacterium]|nr:hypothetical protein [Bacteroidota bacterium]
MSTKFHELCIAFGKAQDDFATYRNNCHHISVELVNEFKIYFQIPESQFSLYKINKGNEFEIVPPALINALSLKEDSNWQFGIGLTVCIAPETLPQELILIHISLRKDLDGKYFVKYGNEIKEFEIKNGDKNSYYLFFDFLHDLIIKTYNEQLQHFIGQSTRRKLGYVM